MICQLVGSGNLRHIVYVQCFFCVPSPYLNSFDYFFFSFPQEDLLRGREVRRQRFGTDVDFADYLPAFQKHITKKAEEVEKEED